MSAEEQATLANLGISCSCRLATGPRGNVYVLISMLGSPADPKTDEAARKLAQKVLSQIASAKEQAAYGPAWQQRSQIRLPHKLPR